MRALVTGASGFVGGALITELKSLGWDLGLIVRDGDPPLRAEHYRVFRGELEDLRFCERAVVEFRPNVIFHLAAQALVGVARRDPFGTFETNVRGTYNLLEAFRRHRNTGPRLADETVFIMASSDKAYGEGRFGINDDDSPTGVVRPYREDDALEGRGPYDCSKSCADLIAQSYAYQYRLRIGIIRAGNIYGPRDPEMSRIVPSLIEDFAAGRALTLRSDGTPVRDYLYIDDAVRGYVRLANYLQGHSDPRHSIFNLSGGEPLSALDLAWRLVRVLESERMRASFVGRASDTWLFGRSDDQRVRVMGERLGEIQHQVLDITRTRDILGWQPNVYLDEGLRRTLLWRFSR